MNISKRIHIDAADLIAIVKPMKTKLQTPMTVLESYITTALWSSVDELTMGPMDDKYSITDFPQSELDKMAADLGKFMSEVCDLVEPKFYAEVAHYFWLTRNGHGSTFSDMEHENAEALYVACSKYREVDLYTSRGWVYCY